MSFVTRGIFWSGIYIGMILVPLFFLIVGPAPAGSGFLWDLSAAFGFVGAAILATMFVLTARFKSMTAPFGIDLIYYFHRQIAIVSVFFIVLHPLLLLAADWRLLFFMRPGASPHHLEAGIGSFVCFVLIMVTSIWRKKMHIHYDIWRFFHVFLSLFAVVLAVVHIHGVGHYVNTVSSRLLWVGIAVCCLLVILYVRCIKPLWLLAHPYCVTRLIAESGDTSTIVLRPLGHTGFTFKPGQFAWLTLWSSPFGMKEHPFSISSSAESSEICFTIKALGDFTRRISEVQPGQIAYVDAPFGAFSIDRHPSDGFVFVAGGIGIAPIMGMLRTMVDRADKRPVLLVYGYNTLEAMTFYAELESLKNRLELSIVYVLKNPPEDWGGETGMIRTELFQEHLTDRHKAYEFLICGPVGMLATTENALTQVGVPMRKIHSELFDLV